MTDLKLDFDRANVPSDFFNRLRMCVRLHGLTVLAIQYRPTRHGWHVRVTVAQRIGFLRVVALQAILGSDWKREAYNSRRALKWRDVSPFWRRRANVLYRRHYRSVAL